MAKRPKVGSVEYNAATERLDAAIGGGWFKESNTFSGRAKEVAREVSRKRDELSLEARRASGELPRPKKKIVTKKKPQGLGQYK